MREESAADTAIPARARRPCDPAPPRPDRTITRPEAIPAPTSAAPIVMARVDTPTTAVADTTTKAAPALMPRTPGSASGLRVIACIIEPASPSAPPIMRAASVRGTRSARTTCASCELPPWTRASHTASAPIWRDPRARDATITATRTSVATAQAATTLAKRRGLISGAFQVVRRRPRHEAGTNCASMDETIPSMRR